MPGRDSGTGDAMLSDTEYRQFVLRIGRPCRPEGEREVSSRESLDTLMLGVLSTSLGIAVLAELGMVMIGGAMRNLSPDILITTTMVGGAMGIAGVVLARRRKRVMSPLSAFGTILCFIPISPILIVMSIGF